MHAVEQFVEILWDLGMIWQDLMGEGSNNTVLYIFFDSQLPSWLLKHSISLFLCFINNIQAEIPG